MSSYISNRIIAKTKNYVVNEVTRSKDGARCAQKLLCSAEPDLIERFQNEVRLLGALDHPNIIKIIDKALNGSHLSVTTPLYEKNLRKWMQDHPFSGSPVDLQKRCFIANCILASVGYAHGQGIIHRDIKPENILLNGDREVVLIDFSISYCPTCSAQRVTMTGQQLGTMLYVAPEQLRNSGTADQRSDIFSIGVLLYELFGGMIGSSQIDVHSIPKRYRSFIERCTLARAVDRYQSIEDARGVWTLLETANTKQSEINEIDALSSTACHNPGQSQRLSFLLDEYSDDIDLIDRFLLSCDLDTVHSQYSYNPFNFRKLLLHWLSFVVENSWPFSKTDVLANRCRAIFDIVGDSEIRSGIVVAMILLAARHNRYYVWRVAGTLCENISDDETAETLANNLPSSCDSDDVLKLRTYTNYSKLHPLIRRVTHRTASEQELSPAKQA
jgi:eukaryotic-like serine/threonine-protein kinase